MKKITVYADFVFLAAPEEIGVLATSMFVVRNILSLSIRVSGSSDMEA